MLLALSISNIFVCCLFCLYICLLVFVCLLCSFHKTVKVLNYILKGGRMGRSDKVSLWCVSLVINTRFRFFYLRISNC